MSEDIEKKDESEDSDLESELESASEPEEEDEEKDTELESEEDEGENMEEEREEIKKVGSDTNESIAFYPPTSVKKKSRKTLYLIILLVIILGVAGFFLRSKLTAVIPAELKPTPTPVATPTPVPTPEPLIRSDWSFEVLNGTTTSGQAKKLADKLTALGFSVVKTGNADKQTFAQTQILVRAELQSKIDLVVADLKDTVKIASVAGELNEGTASARIIIGKDLTL